MKIKPLYCVIIIICLVGAGLMSYQQKNSDLVTLWHVVSCLDINYVASYLRHYGPFAVVVSVLIMIIQSIIAPLPAFIIVFANAIVWGWIKGVLLSWSSALLGASVCFYIARLLGRKRIERLTSLTTLTEFDRFFAKYGGMAILICRLLPFLSFSLISYAAGLTPVSFKRFIIATGIGQLPGVIVYSYVGKAFTSDLKTIAGALFILTIFSFMICLIKKRGKTRLLR